MCQIGTICLYITCNEHEVASCGENNEKNLTWNNMLQYIDTF